MPTYTYRCAKKHDVTKFFRVKDYVEAVDCERCELVAQRVFTAPAMIMAKPDLRYDSPIDGAPITSWDARREDLKRNGCIEYDPEMKTDAARLKRERREAFEQRLETTAKEAVGRLSPNKRAALKKELVDHGVGLEVKRGPC